MRDPHARSDLERRPHLALAAKLLVGLGFAIVLLVIRGQGGAEAAERPLGAPLREVTRTVTGPVRAVTAPVAEVSHGTAAARPTPSAERAVRVLPRSDGTEAIHLDLGLDRLRIPSLLGGLPSVDVSGLGAAVTVDGAVTRHDATVAPVAAAPAGSAARSAAAPTGAGRSARPERTVPAPAERAPRLPVPDGPQGRLPAGVASATASVLAVLGWAAHRPGPQPGQIVHAATRRVSVVPALRPSFTPD